jgi:hypothetical protein
MVNWSEFAEQAPHIAEIFVRRHTKTQNLCLMATTRSDGFPRISPLEPRIVAPELVMVGMPGTSKFKDLARDPRLCLHTATVDPHLDEGDVKIWAQVVDRQDEELHKRFADDLFEASGFDVRGEKFDPFYVADITGASSIELEDNQLVITIWKPGEGEKVVRKT